MGFSLGHLIILGVVLLLFGSRRLPELGSAFGKSARAFREALKGEDEDKKKLPGEGGDR